MSAIATSSGLRSRKVDHRKQMPVYRYDQLLDLDEINSRTLSKVTTGVEKEEEEEHHLQAALLTNSVIPTPEASNLLLNPQNYDAFYPTNFHLPKSLIKFSSQIEDVMGCLYNLDEKDNAWIESLDEEIKSRTTPLAIEQTFYAFEQAGNDKVAGDCPDFETCLQMLQQAGYDHILDQDVLYLIYDYWKNARYELNQGNRLRPRLKFEEMSLNPESDPYVCFRHREIKQLRKVRRSDTVAQEKLHKLKEDLTRARELLQFIHEREQHCKDLLMIDHLIFEKRVTVRKIKKDLGITSNEYLDVSPDQKRKKSKKHLDDHGESTRIRIPLNSLKDASHLVTDMDQHLFDDARLSQEQRILEKIKREKLQNDRNGWIDHTELPFINPQDLFWGRHLGIEMCGFEYKQIKSRRRMGRGGRVVFDRMLISTLPERTMIPKPSAGLGKENHQAIPENISNTIETLEKSDGDNHTVMIDNDTEPTTIMADDIQKSRLMIYRSFHVNATEEQYKCLQTIPSYDLNFDPTQPIPDEEKHFNTIPPQIVRIPIPATTVATTPNPPATLNSTSTTTVKKKKEKTLTKKKQSSTVDTTDARSMAVKTMMKEAQKQAQEAQAQIQQFQANQTG
ncbi:enhancer of polycomb-like-domain-containing protein [Globomyces pollinis-pini]|nr:enhancer of polycomb-like-domain-containing protein [Globomyces pollinis-pini]